MRVKKKMENKGKNILAGLMAILAVAVVFVAVMIPVASATIESSSEIYVPDNFTTIQEAIDAASAGDTVFVLNGTYYEHVTINKELNLMGEDKHNTIIDGGGSGNCIYIHMRTKNVNISGFTIQNGEYGVYIDGGSYFNIIDNNIVQSNSIGIYMYSSKENQISNNNIKSNTKYGINTKHAESNEISGNIIDSNTIIGIYLDDGNEDNRLFSNIVSNNKYGIRINMYSWENEIIGNTIDSNTRYGIYIDFTSGKNKIYHNNIANNEYQAFDQGSELTTPNSWNDSYPTGGNYWSDYTGVDLNHGPYQNITGRDRIGDVPYEIDDDSIDYYPLMGPYGMNIPPIANFTYSPEHATDLDIIQFNDTSTDTDGTIEGWYWEFGDGVTSEEQNATHKYADNGTYRVNLTVTDNDGAKNTTSKQIAVLNVAPSANFSFSPETPGVGEEITFDASNSTDLDGYITKYEWKFGDGDNATTEIVGHSYSSPGDYTVNLTVTDDDGATDVATHTVNVTVPSLKEANVSISTDKKECSPGDVMQISINISNPTENSTVFEWYLGIPQFKLWMPMRKIPIAPGFNESFTIPVPVSDWSPYPFAGYWVVHLLDAGSGKVLSQDAACWAYVPVPGGEGKGDILSREDIAKGIEEGIRGTVFFTAKSAESAESAEKSSNSK